MGPSGGRGCANCQSLPQAELFVRQRERPGLPSQALAWPPRRSAGRTNLCLDFFFLRLFLPLKWSSCAVFPSASSASSSQQAELATVPFFAPLCQHHSLQYRQEVSCFPKANETSWTISSFFPRSKDWHKGGSGKRSKSTSQHPPQRKVLTQPQNAKLDES